MSFTTREFADQTPGRRGKRAWIIGVAAVVVALVIAAVAVIALRGGDSSTSTTPPTNTAPSTTEAPRDLEWKLVNGVRLPFGADGPAQVDGPLAHGFKHSPQGAVIAAWQLSTRLVTDPAYEQLLQHVHGDLGEQQQIRDQVTKVRNFGPEEFTAAFQQPVAFKVAHFDEIFAAIYFAVPSPQGGYDFERRAVVWSGDDWEYQLSSGLPEMANSTGLAGFTNF